MFKLMSNYIGLSFLSAVFFCVAPSVLVADEVTSPLAKEKPSQSSSVPQKTLDGIYVEAVEAYPETKSNEFNLGIGFYPFNAYYQGLSVNGGYTYHFNNTHSWELVNAHYYFTFDKGLTTELARLNVNPDVINRLQYIVTTNGVFNLMKGKFVFIKNYIRYFQASALYGFGAVKTKQKTSFAGNVGMRLGVVIGERFSWGIEVRDTIAVSGFTNIVTFSLLGGYSF